MAEVLRKSAVALAHVGEFLGIDNLDPESGKIFVTGGMGVIGHRVVSRLLNAGYPDVRIGVSDMDSVDEMKKAGAEISDFRWENEETYEKALKGVKSVLITLPYEDGWNKHFEAFLRACNEAHVKHLVKLSFYHARVFGDPHRQVPFVKKHAKCDEMLLAAIRRLDDLTFPKASYTILYATTCMSQPIKLKYHGPKVDDMMEPSISLLGTTNLGTNYISPNDVAEVAVRVLLEPRAHYDKEYTLTGPGPITNTFIAESLTKHFKAPVKYVHVSPEEYEDSLKYEGKPDWMIADMVAMEKLKASGTYENVEFVSHQIEELCDHVPESFDDYLARTDTMTPIERGAPPELKPLKEPVDFPPLRDTVAT